MFFCLLFCYVCWQSVMFRYIIYVLDKHWYLQNYIPTARLVTHVTHVCPKITNTIDTISNFTNEVKVISKSRSFQGQIVSVWISIGKRKVRLQLKDILILVCVCYSINIIRTEQNILMKQNTPKPFLSPPKVTSWRKVILVGKVQNSLSVNISGFYVVNHYVYPSVNIY